MPQRSVQGAQLGGGGAEPQPGDILTVSAGPGDAGAVGPCKRGGVGVGPRRALPSPQALPCVAAGGPAAPAEQGLS